MTSTRHFLQISRGQTWTAEYAVQNTGGPGPHGELEEETVLWLRGEQVIGIEGQQVPLKASRQALKRFLCVEGDMLPTAGHVIPPLTDSRRGCCNDSSGDEDVVR